MPLLAKDSTREVELTFHLLLKIVQRGRAYNSLIAKNSKKSEAYISLIAKKIIREAELTFH